jgi:hypothetical protein
LVVGGWQRPVQKNFEPFINDGVLRAMFLS